MNHDSKNQETCQTVPLFAVYVIWCRITDMHYVGVTSKQPYTRICQHRWNNRQFIGREIHRIGWDGNWDWWIVETNVPADQISEREQYWVSVFNSVYPNGYNKTCGGIWYFKHNEEFKEKMRQANLGRKHKDESKEKMRQSHLGKKHKDESKEKMRQSHLGKKHTEEHKEKTRQARLGKHPTEEARANMRKSHLGKKHTEEEKAKIGKAHLGRKRSEKTKALMREKALAREARKRAAKAVAEENLAAAYTAPTNLSNLLDAVIT